MSLRRTAEVLGGGDVEEARSVCRRILHDKAGSYTEGAVVVGCSTRHFLGMVHALGLAEYARDRGIAHRRRFRLRD